MSNVKQPPQRGYQFEYSKAVGSLFDEELRKRKAQTVLTVLVDFFQTRGKEVIQLDLLNVGSSTGIVDNYLAPNVATAVGIDIDHAALRFAVEHRNAENLAFVAGDALQLPFTDASFDIVICAQVYEHVPDAKILLSEIYRVLRSGGGCYFSANNRFMLREPHHHLPLLAALPRPLAHLYLRLSGKGRFYYEKHYSYWGLKSLTAKFHRVDYTRKLIEQSERFGTGYMIAPGGLKSRLASWVVKHAYWASPGYVWMLEKPISR